MCSIFVDSVHNFGKSDGENISEKVLFLIDALVFWCPTWSKNLGRTLFGSPTPMKVKCWIFFCLDYVLVFHSDSKWDCFFVYQPTIKTDRNIVNCLSMHFYLSKTLYNFLFLDGKKPKESCDNKIIQLCA